MNCFGYMRRLCAQIHKFQNSTSASEQQSGGAGNRLAGAIESTWQARDSLKVRLAVRLQAEHEAVRKRRVAADLHVANFSAIPKYLRDGTQSKSMLRNNALLINGKNNLAANLDTLQTRSLLDGQEAIKNSKNKPTLRLNLTAKDLDDVTKGKSKSESKEMLAPAADVEDEVSGNLDFDALFAKARALSNGTNLVKVRGLNNPTPNELERRYLSDDLLGHQMDSALAALHRQVEGMDHD